ncbi:MAG: hypothetical protein K6F69_06670 [Treponema sp.]|nr:hypothetical protein [Treponema sp.]
MSDSILSEILVLFLMAMACVRVFYLRQPRIDALASLPPIALLISIMNIYIWGLSVLELLILVLSILIFIINIPALMKLSTKLLVDFYHPIFIFISILLFLLTILTAVFSFMFRPVAFRSTGLTEECTYYVGRFATGFTESTGMFDPVNAKVWKFTPDTEKEEKAIILFIGDKRANTEQYRPYLHILARNGYTVIAADFYAKDMKWIDFFPDTPMIRKFIISLKDLTNTWDKDVQKTAYAARIAREYAALIQIADDLKLKSNEYYLVGDEMCKDALSLAASLDPASVIDTFCLSDVEGYNAGYGCIEQTDPLLAYLHNQKRDNTMQIPKTLAKATDEHYLQNHTIVKEADKR